jgi:hypothetical protein
VEAAERNGQNDGASPAEEGIVTVVSATEAAAARAGATVADKMGDDDRAARLQRRADRAARGEADHNLTGILLYALSTVRTLGISGVRVSVHQSMHGPYISKCCKQSVDVLGALFNCHLAVRRCSCQQ